MNILVTAGNTLTPIDKVRCLTNIFTGRTGAAIALEACRRGHRVTLLTSHPEAVDDLANLERPASDRWSIVRYRTFDELEKSLADLVRRPGLDALVHSAAVSDYRPAGIYAPGPATRFREADARWENAAGQPPALVDRSAGKVKSDVPELWLRLTRTPKLIDRVRTDWAFRGVLVKFKLEVGISDGELMEIAEKSRAQSAADLMVANTLEGASHWAYLGTGGGYERISRRELPSRLLAAIEQLYQERHHG
jgi:phosphopantothenoylcysteine synthetase/decarboxylase